MSKYGSNYEWWMHEPKCNDIRHWVLDNDGLITIQDVIEALHQHPGSHLAIVEPEYNLFVKHIGNRKVVK